MSSRISFKIILFFVSFVLLVALLFNYANYTSIKEWNEEVNIEKTKSKSYEITEDINKKFTDFEISIREMALNINLSDEPGYYINKLALSFPSIENIFLYSDEFSVEYAVEKSEEDFRKIEKSISKYTLLNSSMWDTDGESLYIFHYNLTSGKYQNYRVSIIINIRDFIGEILEGEENYEVYDSYFKSLNSSNFNDQTINIDTNKELMVNGYYEAGISDGEFYSYGSIDASGLDLFYYYTKNNSDYKAMARSYYIKNISLTIFLVILSTLVAWRLIGLFHREILKAISSEKYQENEFSILDRKLRVAIHWIEDVMNHYSELGHLKEELLEIVETLPKEGELHDKRDLRKILKEKRLKLRKKKE